MPVDVMINNVIPRTVAGVWTSFSENRRVWVGFDGGGRAVCVCATPTHWNLGKALRQKKQLEEVISVSPNEDETIVLLRLL